MIKEKRFNRGIYVGLLILLAASLPLSIFATSLIQILLLINWFFEGEYRDKWERLKANKAFWIFAMFFIVLLLGMFWSSDLVYGLNDLKIKLPVIFIPFIIVSSAPLSEKDLKLLLNGFIAATIIASFVSMLAILQVIQVDLSDYRNASLFISHIRFSLMVVLATAFAFYYLFIAKKVNLKVERFLYFFSLIWLPVFLIILRSLSGVVIFIVLVFVITLMFIRRNPDKAGRFMLTVFVVFIPLFALIYVSNAVNRFYSFDEIIPEEIDSLTIEGNEYINLLENRETENGHFVWIHVCPKELEREWKKLSDVPYMGKSKNDNLLRLTLIRYLTSKDLRKDSAGMAQLDCIDIDAIELGDANYIFLNKFALYPRIYEAIWEFDRYRLGDSPNDKSLVQRMFYLEAGLSIVKDNLWFGVGTGDVQSAFNEYYEATDSPLRHDRRRRAHNQYLTFVVSNGVIGALVCLFALLFPVFMKKRWDSYLVFVLLVTMGLSMLNEDTLENTPGVVMFGLFYGLFVLSESVNSK